MRNTRFFWGAILILLGSLLLADTYGFRLPNNVRLINLFWPVMLLLAGAWVLFGSFMRVNVNLEAETDLIDLQGATSAFLKVSHGAGEVKFHSGANANELLHGSFDGGLDKKVYRNGDRLEVRVRPARDVFDFPFFGVQSQIDWDVALNQDVPLELNMNLGANKSMLDFQDLNVTRLDVDAGASDTTITLPSRGRFKADFDIGAASLVLILPEGLSARIRANVAAGDVNVDSNRFPRNERYYQSPDFETAVNAADITIDAGAASIKIK